MSADEGFQAKLLRMFLNIFIPGTQKPFKLHSEKLSLKLCFDNIQASGTEVSVDFKMLNAENFKDVYYLCVPFLSHPVCPPVQEELVHIHTEVKICLY